MAKFIKIALWNAKCLAQHRDEVRTFLDHNAIDILLVSETHFTDRSYFKIPHYNAYFTNHPENTANAGSGILIKNTIRHYELPKFEKNFLQAKEIKVKMKTYELAAAVVYCPSRHNIKEGNFFEFFQTLGNKFIAGGDYICKNSLWGSRLTIIKGRELLKQIQNLKYSFLTTGTPTYWPGDPDKIPDLLDFYITSGISPSNMSIASSYDLSSDHTPIIAMASNKSVNKSTPRLHNRRTNWQDYPIIIEKAVNLNISPRYRYRYRYRYSPDHLRWQSSRRSSTSHSNSKPQTRSINIPSEIKELIAEKRRARKIWQQSHAPSDRNTYNWTTTI
jgi:hypothetical protein